MPSAVSEHAVAGTAANESTGKLEEADDLVADLTADLTGNLKLTQLSAEDPGSTEVSSGTGQLQPSSTAQALGTQNVAELQAVPAVELTPEQDAAAEQFCQQFVELYERAFLSRAVEQLAQACQQQGVPESAVAQKLRTRGVDLAQLQGRAAEVQRGVAECASDEGWTLIQDGELRMMYRHQPGSTVHCFKGSCILPAPMEQPLSMAREFDLVKTWNNYITHSRILKVFCDVDILVYASVWLPWPFAERDVLISAVADDQLKDHGVVAVSFASPKETPADADLPPGADQRVHVYFTQGSCMTLTPVAVPDVVTVQRGAVQAGSSSSNNSSRQHTKVVIVSNIDTQLAHVPEAIIHFILRVFAPFMFKTVLGVLHSSFDDPSAPLPQRMAQHHELYDDMRQRCQDWLDGHPK